MRAHRPVVMAAAGDLAEARKVELRRAFNALVGVAQQLTQQQYFKANFMGVVEDILRHAGPVGQGPWPWG